MKKYLPYIIAFIVVFVPAGLLLEHWGGFNNDIATLVETVISLLIYLVVCNKIKGL